MSDDLDDMTIDSTAYLVMQIRVRTGNLAADCFYPAPGTRAILLRATNRLEEYHKALIPFANAARSPIVQDALTFGRDAPHLKLTRDPFSRSEGIDPWAFAEALKLT